MSEGVSYGMNYRSPGSVKICTVPVGYADGLIRLLSGKIDFAFNDRAVHQVGNICMDQLMLDVTDLPEEVKPGDVVTMFGTDGDASITADELAALYGTIGLRHLQACAEKRPALIMYHGITYADEAVPSLQ